MQHTGHFFQKEMDISLSESHEAKEAGCKEVGMGADTPALEYSDLWISLELRLLSHVSC